MGACLSGFSEEEGGLDDAIDAAPAALPAPGTGDILTNLLCAITPNVVGSRFSDLVRADGRRAPRPTSPTQAVKILTCPGRQSYALSELGPPRLTVEGAAAARGSVAAPPRPRRVVRRSRGSRPRGRSADRREAGPRTLRGTRGAAAGVFADSSEGPLPRGSSEGPLPRGSSEGPRVRTQASC